MRKAITDYKCFKAFKGSAFAVSAVSMMFLSACALDTPTQISKAPITVSQEMHSVSYDTVDVKQATLEGLRDHYLANGDGTIKVLVTYDPRSTKNTAMNASNNAGQIAQAMKKMGAKDVKTEILPVKDSGDTSETVFSYDAYAAHAPENCEFMGGIEGTDVAITDEYMFGCSRDMLLARQIANPQDLLGRAGTDTATARRHANWIPSYNDGTPNAPLEADATTE